MFTGKLESRTLVDFVEENSVPTLVDFSDEFIEPIFQKQKPAIFLFRDEESADSKALDELFGKAAIANKGKIIFSVSGVTKGIQQ